MSSRKTSPVAGFSWVPACLGSQPGLAAAGLCTWKRLRFFSPPAMLPRLAPCPSVNRRQRVSMCGVLCPQSPSVPSARRLQKQGLWSREKPLSVPVQCSRDWVCGRHPGRSQALWSWGGLPSSAGSSLGVEPAWGPSEPCPRASTPFPLPPFTLRGDFVLEHRGQFSLSGFGVGVGGPVGWGHLWQLQIRCHREHGFTPLASAPQTGQAAPHASLWGRHVPTWAWVIPLHARAPVGRACAGRFSVFGQPSRPAPAFWKHTHSFIQLLQRRDETATVAAITRGKMEAKRPRDLSRLDRGPRLPLPSSPAPLLTGPLGRGEFPQRNNCPPI